MSIKAEFIGMKPAIEVETNRFFKDGKVNFVSIEIGDLVLELDEKDADYLREKIDFALWDETKEDLENKVEDLELKISRLEERIDEVATTHEESDNIWLNSEQ
ncbi:MAG TPA: hypothetical protein VMV86_04715 [Methanosarcinales archaeon]|nr:hypothetical protein [Methanosarcinales archaeon]